MEGHHRWNFLMLLSIEKTPQLVMKGSPPFSLFIYLFIFAINKVDISTLKTVKQIDQVT